jgi:subtilase family serine protease
MKKNTLAILRIPALIFAAVLYLVIAAPAESTLQALHNQVLRNHVRSVVASGKATPLGLLPPTQRLNLVITLPLRNESGLDNLLSEIYDPASPKYRQFLSVAEFTEQFGPSESDYQSVVDFATAHGFTVTDTPANRLLVDINGTVAQIEKAFHVTMMVYQHPTENRTFYSPDREPSLDLAVPVSHIGGLNNFSIPHPKLVKRPAGQAIRGNVTGSGPQGTYRPSDMRAAYYGGTALTGAGQSVGLLEFDGYELADVTGDMGGESFTVPIVNVLIDGGSASSDGNDGEQAIDIAQPIGMAPGLTSVHVYIAPITGTIGVVDTDMFNRMATDNIAKQLSCSWGWAPDDPGSDDPIFKEFAAQGQNLFVASGDEGAYTGNNNNDEGYPADDVYVVGVGGTDLTTNGAGGPWESETAWSYSSGGPSDDGFAIPSWQQGIANSANDASSTIRDVPDVAAEANFDNILCDDGTCYYNNYGGTSYAAPRWAGYLALLNQQAVSNGVTNVGFINPALYAIGKGSSYDTDFHDITSGNNNNGGGQSYNAVTGYDMVTGWGSPNGQNLINALAQAPTPGFTIGASAPSLAVLQGSSASAKITVASQNNFNSATTLNVAGLPSGVSAAFSSDPVTPPANGHATTILTLTASDAAVPATYTVTVTATSGALNHNVTLTLTVYHAIHIHGAQ